jgi:hypothetical protein
MYNIPGRFILFILIVSSRVSKVHPISACVSGNFYDFIKQRLCAMNKIENVQDEERTYNVKLRYVHTTIVAVGRQ